MTARQFRIDVDRMIRGARAAPDLFVRAFVAEMAREVVIATPVDTGFLRASWDISIGSPFTEANAGSYDTTGAQTIAALAIKATQIKSGQTVYLLNSASYAEAVEFGTDRMAGRAYVRGTAARAQTVAKRVAARLKRAS